MDKFNFSDFEDIDKKAMGLAEDRGEPDLQPVGQRKAASGNDSPWQGDRLRRTGTDADGQEGGMNNRGGRRTDPIAVTCIREYENRGLSAEAELRLRQRGTVHVAPLLVWEGSEASLEVTVGDTRQYVVRSLLDLCRRMEEGGVFLFGKNFSIRCAEETFHEDSVEVIRFVMERYRQVKSLERLGFNYSHGVFMDKLFTRSGRGMNLTPEALDEFLELYRDQSIMVSWRAPLRRRYGSWGSFQQGDCREFTRSFERRLALRDGRPMLELQVEKEESGIQVRISTLPLTLYGQRYLYLCFAGSPDLLWRCDEEYRKAVWQFLTALKQNGGSLYVAEGDMVRFCGSVLPALQEFAEFSGDTECLSRYVPEQMAAKVYLDSPAKDVIAAAAKGDYNGVLVDLYSGREEDRRGESEKAGPEKKLLRNDLQEQRLRLRLEQWFSEVDQRTGILYLRGDDDALYDFLREGQRELAAHAQIFVTDRYRRLLFPAKTKAAARVSLDSQLLKVTFDFEGIPPEELLDALSSYRAKRRFHRLSDGTFVNFEEEELRDALEFAEGMHLTKEEIARGAVELPRYRAMYLDGIMKKAETIRFDRDGEFRRLIREIHGVEDSEIEPPVELDPVLRDYQKTGFRWLSTMARLGFGGILADDMGLGKTLEIIALLISESGGRRGGGEEEDVPAAAAGRHGSLGSEAAAADNAAAAAQAERVRTVESHETVGAGDEVTKTGEEPGEDGKRRILALVVCPASLVLNWEQELIRFAPGLLAFPVMGTAGERKKRIALLAEAVREPEVDLVSETMPSSKGDHGPAARLSSGRDLDPAACVVITSYDLLKRDLPLYEGIPFDYHIVDEAQYIKNYSTQNAKAVKGVDSLHRFALTGTPVENRLSELWSIFDFLMPDFLGPYGKFKEEYELPVLRDRDEDRTGQLRAQIMPFVLRRLKRKVLSELPDKVESVVCVPMSAEQRKIYLSNLAKVKLEIGKEIREGGFESSKLQILAMLTRLRQICCHPALCYENYTKDSGKLEACLELIREAVDGGHRVLLFSQFTSMFPIIAERLQREKIGFYTLTGQTAKTQRQELVDRFNEGGAPVFLISLKAGGTGLNLTGADVVIHYDPWWNEAAQNQATDRAHRMGQRNSVQVYKLVARDTIEEKIVKLQESKTRLADAVIGENSLFLSMLDEKQLEELFL
ncbi:DEAD/DEAH box helicase [Bacilliculturomica massiliensis]|uniref:DEAD/DEAH box helicase n=1 Tax=Bacilliculturomica massiliensis TaxID=1917867 RepID=UPI0010310939|nr:DEAD/DEAH box helicase [Bacilliculturomica massiliensis]